ncbi:hypothetical protein EBU94_02160 [bacterium]|nr:hypothetical protein [bacterium]
MNISKIDDYVRGWYVGDFQPSCYRTSHFEVGLNSHRQNEKWPIHFHKISTEINLLIEGEMTINGKKIESGDIFILEPNEIADPVFLTDCKILVVKTPSVKNDKYEIN